MRRIISLPYPRSPARWCLVILLQAGCAATPVASDLETETTSESGSTTTIGLEASSSSSTGPAQSLWDPERDVVSFVAGSNAADAAWLSTGFVVVERGGARLFDEEGAEVGAFDAHRPVYAATFDRDRIVLGDTARFIVLDANLVELSSGNLIEPCRTGVVFDDLFVCGSSQTGREAYTSYDLETGAFVAMLEDVADGVLMRRVAGRSEFVALPVQSPAANYQLFARVGDTVEFRGESPHEGEFFIDAHYALLGEPSTHLLSIGGELLRIHADAGGCEPTKTIDPGESCLVRDGTLGHLPPGVLRYHDVQTGAQGTVFALYSRAQDFFDERPCADEPCVLQEIDPVTNTLLREREVNTGQTRHHYLYPHPDGRGVAIVVSQEDRWRDPKPEASSGLWEAYYVGM